MFAAAQESVLDKRLSISFNNTTLEKALEQLENEINYSFSYKSNLIKLNNTVNTTFNNKVIKEILTALINDPTITYLIIGKNIIFVKNTSITKPIATNTKKPINSKRITHPILQKDTTTLKPVPLNELTTPDSNNTLAPIQFIEQIYFKPRASYAIEFIASPALQLNEYSVTTTAYTNNMNIIKQAETPLFSKSAGILMHTLFSKFTITTGVQYTYNSSNVTYNIPQIKYDSTHITHYDTVYSWEPKLVVKYYISPQPGDTDWISVYDTINKMELNNPHFKSSTNNKQYRHKNTYSFLEIPLNISYTLYTYNKLELAFNAGIRAGLFIQSNGSTLAIDNQNTIQNLADMPFTKINLLYNIGLGIHYKFGNQLALTIQPYFKNSMYSMYQNYPLSVKTSYWGLQVGIRYRFIDLFNKLNWY